MDKYKIEDLSLREYNVMKNVKRHGWGNQLCQSWVMYALVNPLTPQGGRVGQEIMRQLWLP